MVQHRPLTSSGKFMHASSGLEPCTGYDPWIVGETELSKFLLIVRKWHSQPGSRGRALSPTCVGPATFSMALGKHGASEIEAKCRDNVSDIHWCSKCPMTSRL
jgi:hypothetical protein